MKCKGLSPTAIPFRHLLHALALVPVLAQASEYLPTFFDMDKDGDGVISREEADYWSVLIKHWSRFDADGSGGIDLREWEAVDLERLVSGSDP